MDTHHSLFAERADDHGRLRMLGAVKHAKYLIALASISLAVCGCAPNPISPELPFLPDIGATQNPTMVNVQDQDFLWAQITDELDNYFKIRREERVRIVHNVLTDGWVETYPVTGASIFEPWRRDATNSYQRWLGTFQSIRRWARVEVSPVGNQFKIEVFVFRELEDLDRPVAQGVGGLTLRHDNSPEEIQDPTWYEPESYGWISLGRDIELEQKIIANIVSRLAI